MIEQDGVTGLRPRITNGPLPCLVEGREHPRHPALGRSYRSGRVHERAVMRSTRSSRAAVTSSISSGREGRDVRIPVDGVGPIAAWRPRARARPDHRLGRAAVHRAVRRDRSRALADWRSAGGVGTGRRRRAAEDRARTTAPRPDGSRSPPPKPDCRRGEGRAGTKRARSRSTKACRSRLRARPRRAPPAHRSGQASGRPKGRSSRHERRNASARWHAPSSGPCSWSSTSPNTALT